MKRADIETTVGGRVTEGRLREASVSLCRNKVMLFHVPLKTLSQWAEAERAHQPDRMIARRTGSKGPLLSGKGGTQMIYRFQPLLSNHYPKTDSTK